VKGVNFCACPCHGKHVSIPLAVARPPIPWDFVLILGALGTLVPWRGAARIRRLLAQPAISSGDRVSLYVSTIVSEWLIVGILAWRALSRGMNLADLGLADTGLRRTLFLTVALTFVLCVTQWASLRSLARLSPGQRGFMYRFMDKIMPRNLLESLVFVGLACTAGFAEEFIYRGFVFAVFTDVPLQSRFLSTAMTAALASSALFAVAHLYQGRRGLSTTFIVGLIFCLVRIWAGNLLPSSVAHTGMDLVAGLYASHLFRFESDSQC
jgi:membrane protease YdiL (CAAX protease family)